MLTLPALTESPVDGVVVFGDHAVDRLGYVLPHGVAASTDTAGWPEVLLLRYRAGDSGGGLLRFTLGWQPLETSVVNGAAAVDWAVRPVPFDTVRARLVQRVGGGADPLGPWIDVVVDGPQLATLHLGLDAHSVELMRQLVDGGAATLDVQLSASFHGLVRGVPFLVSADRQQLQLTLQATLGPEPATAPAVEAAFRSMPFGSLLRPTQLDPEARLDPDLLAVETARRALDLLFDRVGGAGPDDDRYQLKPAVSSAQPLVFDLQTARQQSAAAEFSWSLTDVLTGLTDDVKAALFPSVTTVEPFATVRVPVVCDIPFDTRFLVGVQCDLRFTGARGVPEFRTLHFPAGGPVQTIDVSYPALVTDLDLAMRLRSTLAPPFAGGWPRVVAGDYLPLVAPLAEIDRTAIDIDFVRVRVDPMIGSLADVFRVTFNGSTSVDLTVTQPAAWVALPRVQPGEPINATVSAIGSGGATVVIREGVINDRQLTVAVSDLEPLLAQQVSITLDPAADFAYVAVTLQAAGGPAMTRTLTPGVPVHWSTQRPSLFDPLQFAYQLSVVRYDDEHHTLPLQLTEWTTVTGTELIIAPVLPAPLPTA